MLEIIGGLVLTVLCGYLMFAALTYFLIGQMDTSLVEQFKWYPVAAAIGVLLEATVFFGSGWIWWSVIGSHISFNYH